MVFSLVLAFAFLMLVACSVIYRQVARFKYAILAFYVVVALVGFFQVCNHGIPCETTSQVDLSPIGFIVGSHYKKVLFANACLFVPLALWLVCTNSRMPWWVVQGMLLIAVPLMQYLRYLLRQGTFDMGDIVLQLLGFPIAYGIAVFIRIYFAPPFRRFINWLDAIDATAKAQHKK